MQHDVESWREEGLRLGESGIPLIRAIAREASDTRVPGLKYAVNSYELESILDKQMQQGAPFRARIEAQAPMPGCRWQPIH